MVTLGNTVTVIGTVDGFSCTVYYPSSQTFANVLLFEAFIQPLMLAVTPIPLVGFTGTWTA
jgi:hypothetical protein